VSIYLSMQRVRFSSASGYEKFKNIFADVRQHLKSLLGFLHLTWWVHAEDPAMRLPFSGDAGDAEQLCRIQGCRVRPD
jgi:hypothetical protein